MEFWLKIKKILKSWRPGIYAIAGSFIISAGWNWYHTAKRPHLPFILLSLVTWVVVMFGYWIFVRLYEYAVRRWQRHPFWINDFRNFLSSLFFIASLLFLVFFSKNEIFSLVYVMLVFCFLFWRLQSYLRRHPAAEPWLKVNKTVFILSLFIFLLQSVLQYISYKYYILDEGAKYYNIVFFRAFAMSMFWLAWFAIGGFVFWKLKSWGRYVVAVVWSLFYVVSLLVWAINIGVLYYSGLFFSPVALQHARGSAQVVFESSSIILVVLFLGATVGFALVLRLIIRAHRSAPERYWYYYQAAALILAVLSIFGLSSFRNTPEKTIAKSFYEHYFGKENKADINPLILKKLERFGLQYDLNKFFVAEKEKVYASADTTLLPTKFSKNKPNIIIVYLESMSARLTSVYNSRFAGVTPGLEKMSTNKNTTIFRNYYNSSTPTITGLISGLCSFLPPTGHEEIDKDRKLQRHNLLCLPEVLKENGYKKAVYITAVNKEFAHKDGIFYSMGVDEVWGEAELKAKITGEPLAWGYSDHQLFPVMWEEAKKQTEPFLMMLSTVDMHPPFDLAKDMIKYGDGKNNVLNSAYTTDNAFSKFWDEFQASPLAQNTIVIAVADHAVFPAGPIKALFPKESANLSYYDELTYMAYIPGNILPKEVKTFSTALDFTPTWLQVLGLSRQNSFEGHSVFDDRSQYPNLLGMHELGLYINQLNTDGQRIIDYEIPTEVKCPAISAVSENLTLCEFKQFYAWKRMMFEEGRFWKE